MSKRSIVFTNISHACIGGGLGAVETGARALLLGRVSDETSRIVLTGFGYGCASHIFTIAALRLTWALDHEARTLRVPGIPTITLDREQHDEAIEVTEFVDAAPGVIADFIAERTTQYTVAPNVLIPITMAPADGLALLRRVEKHWGLLPKDLTKPRTGAPR